jgi:hypothetical protein
MNKEIEYNIGDLFQKPHVYYNIPVILIGLLVSIEKYEGKWLLQDKDIADIYVIEWYYKNEQPKFRYSKRELKYYISDHNWKHITQ